MKNYIFLLILVISAVLIGCGEQQKAEPQADNREWTEDQEEAETDEENIPETPEEAVNSESLYRLNENNWTLETIAAANEKVVLLTIDDAPDKHALDMAKTLHKLNAEAIFFVNGHFIDTPEKAKAMKEIYELGFPIGNHTMNHSNLKDLTEQQQYDEIVNLNDRIEEITGERPRFFRAPFGSNTEYSKRLAADEHMLLMNWSYGYDWEKGYQTKDAIADIMVNSPYLTNGANLLMHDRQWTSEALEQIVTGLRGKGFEIADPHAIELPH